MASASRILLRRRPVRPEFSPPLARGGWGGLQNQNPKAEHGPTRHTPMLVISTWKKDTRLSHWCPNAFVSLAYQPKETVVLCQNHAKSVGKVISEIDPDSKKHRLISAFTFHKTELAISHFSFFDPAANAVQPSNARAAGRLVVNSPFRNGGFSPITHGLRATIAFYRLFYVRIHYQVSRSPRVRSIGRRPSRPRREQEGHVDSVRLLQSWYFCQSPSSR